ncbi:hypothetical protein FWC31_01395 [Candidatus Saccharibacteria bacterium]|nr:hypothetical protein [Candidatus Saccharibacteria bacterium]
MENSNPGSFEFNPESASRSDDRDAEWRRNDSFYYERCGWLVERHASDLDHAWNSYNLMLYERPGKMKYLSDVEVLDHALDVWATNSVTAYDITRERLIWLFEEMSDMRALPESIRECLLRADIFRNIDLLGGGFAEFEKFYQHSGWPMEENDTEGKASAYFIRSLALGCFSGDTNPAEFSRLIEMLNFEPASKILLDYKVYQIAKGQNEFDEGNYQYCSSPTVADIIRQVVEQRKATATTANKSVADVIPTATSANTGEDAIYMNEKLLILKLPFDEKKILTEAADLMKLPDPNPKSRHPLLFSFLPSEVERAIKSAYRLRIQGNDDSNILKWFRAQLNLTKNRENPPVYKQLNTDTQIIWLLMGKNIHDGELPLKLLPPVKKT